MFKHLTAIIAGTLIALAIAPANATHKDGPHGDSQFIEAVFDLLRPKTIFVSSITYTGNLVAEANTLLGTSFSNSEGLEAGDALCQDLADSPGSVVPEGTYAALLSGTNAAVGGRIIRSSGPYVRADGAAIASGFADLFRATSLGDPVPERHLVVMNRDETGHVTNDTVWTGSIIGGASGLLDCADWTSGLVTTFGVVGDSFSLHREWIDDGILSCNLSHRLFCVEQ